MAAGADDRDLNRDVNRNLHRLLAIGAAALLPSAPPLALGEPASPSAVALASRGAAEVPAAERGTDSSVVILLKPAAPVPGVSSAALTQRAWKALERKEYGEVFLVTDEVVSRCEGQALKQQGRLKAFAPSDRASNYSALNDVATCLFIRGRALRELKRNGEAKQAFKEILQNYRFAQCWDTKGWFWPVASAAQDEINSMDFNVDFGDYRSETLTTRAWNAFNARRYEAVDLYARKCVELYGATARQMQSGMQDFASKGQEFDYWALNDVATCLFIRAKSLQKQGRRKEAMTVFQEILDQYSFAQCWNPNGWFWKVGEAARRNLVVTSS